MHGGEIISIVFVKLLLETIGNLLMHYFLITTSC